MKDTPIDRYTPRALLKDALEIQEDIALSGFAEKREKSWNDSMALSHDNVWS